MKNVLFIDMQATLHNLKQPITTITDGYWMTHEKNGY